MCRFNIELGSATPKFQSLAQDSQNLVFERKAPLPSARAEHKEPSPGKRSLWRVCLGSRQNLLVYLLPSYQSICLWALDHRHKHINTNMYIYICLPNPEDLPGGLYVATSVSPSQHLAFGSNPSVCLIISHATVVFALLVSRTIPTKCL